MNENLADEFDSLAGTARQKASEIAESAQDVAVDALSAAETYIRQNPWLAVGGALAAGFVVAALMPRHRPQPDRLHAVKDWLEDSYAKLSDQLPEKDEVQSMAQSGLSCLGRKLHLW